MTANEFKRALYALGRYLERNSTALLAYGGWCLVTWFILVLAIPGDQLGNDPGIEYTFLGCVVPPVLLILNAPILLYRRMLRKGTK